MDAAARVYCRPAGVFPLSRGLAIVSFVAVQGYAFAPAAASHVPYGTIMSHVSAVLEVADQMRRKTPPKSMNIAVIYDKLARCFRQLGVVALFRCFVNL